ncbi:hypothetical protein MHUMG1_07325 [Metarhizium humberi]|uniref:Ankyrin repeat containing protein n=1 Tax=Metarhizium humberi TaxID=2596975 RepID=A0A9P8M7M2_9HYPO|nr:hypothetical protein MHUMG1_07325 [Metarhizium humberi]
MGPTLAQQHAELSALLAAPSDADCEHAQQLMLQHRLEANKRVGGDLSYKDANGVLSKVAQGIIVVGVTPALVQALLEYDANVSIARFKSTNFWKAIRGKDQVDVRSHVLEQALRTCSDAIVLCLAQNADDMSINAALPIAIDLDDVLKVYILLKQGGNASELCQSFQKAVQDGSDEMVATLMTDGKGVCQDCRNKGLVQAARRGYEAKANMLLNHGADVGFDRACALLSAIRGGSPAIAENIALRREMSQYPLLGDMAAAEAYDQQQYRLLEMLLDSGAKGPNMDAILAKALEKNQLKLAQALVEHGALIPDKGEACLLSAVKSGRPELLQVALQSRPKMDILASAIVYATKLTDLDVCRRMIALLLSAGVRGDSVCETLVQILDKTLEPSEEQTQRELIHLLLQNGKADINFGAGRAVALVVTQGRSDLVDLFLQHGPSTETLIVALGSAMDLAMPQLRSELIQLILGHKSGRSERLREAAIAAAAKRLRVEVLNSLISDTTSKATFSAALAALVSGSCKWLTPDGLTIVQTLVERGASGVALDDAFCQAVRFCDRQAMGLLMEFVGDTAFDAALMHLVQHSKDWQSPEQLWLVEELLGRCSGLSVNELLLEAVNACTDSDASLDLVDTIFIVRPDAANVNYKHGEAVKRAIRGGGVSLLRTLIETGATAETMTQAFMATIQSSLTEETVLHLLETLVCYAQQSGTGFDANMTFKDGLPPLASCLLSYPQSSKLVERLIQLGCNAETTFSCKICADKGAVPESITVLHWALCPRGNGQVPTDVMAKLIEAKANVNCIASSSHATPLILAARHGRSDVIRKLLDAGANPNSRDQSNRSALFYASQSGDSETARQLVKANARANDGSLHEAARNLRSKVVEILIQGKHEPNFPSNRPEHEGRTALQELAFKCDATRGAMELEETILALDKGKADVLSRYDGRNALFLALENLGPCQVTSAVLNTVMWREINNEQNVFVSTDPNTGAKYCFSPTMYLQKGCYCGDPKHLDKLMQLLHQMQCVDRFYAEPGPGQPGFAQPPGTTGMPKRLLEVEERRRAEEEKQLYKDIDHRRKLERQREEAQVKADIEYHSQRQKMNPNLNPNLNLNLNHAAAGHQTEMEQRQAKVSWSREAALETRQAVTARMAQQEQKLHLQQLQNKENVAFQKKKNRLTAEGLAAKWAPGK